ncbi:uncharacterized protein [Nicotiana tomentosiformis]|uniref:uncharacterized protein n=1 Tax=Nicotiana tomentosiformis TaxID=4098 RepID=UPI00388C9BAB
MAINNGNLSATVVAMTIALSSQTVVPPAEKSGNFSGANFKGWKQRVFTDLPCLEEFLCKGYILSALKDDLYNVYSAMKASKELLDALEKKQQNRGTQVEEIQLIFHDLIVEGMVVNEAFQVAAMIEKLPHTWRDFKNYLKHKCKEMKLEDLVIRLKIEEGNKTAKKKSCRNSTIMGANIIKETAPKSKKRKRSSGQTKEHNKKKFKGNCYNCGKADQKAPDCRLPKKDKKKGQDNIVEKNDDIDDLCAMLPECNLVGNPKEWWIDSGSTRHVCVVKEAFLT